MSHLYTQNIYAAFKESLHCIIFFFSCRLPLFWFDVWELSGKLVHHLIPLISFQSLPEEEPAAAVADFGWDLRPAAAPAVAAGDFSHFQRAWKPAENQPHQN